MRERRKETYRQESETGIHDGGRDKRKKEREREQTERERKTIKERSLTGVTGLNIGFLLSRGGDLRSQPAMRSPPSQLVSILPADLAYFIFPHFSSTLVADFSMPQWFG